MNNVRFVAISIIIFAVQFLLSVLWPKILAADLFIILALALFFEEGAKKINPALFLAVVIFFDLWSGLPFGIMTLALVSTMLTILLLKKLILEDRNFLYSLWWLAGFYYLNLFWQSGFSALIQKKWIYPFFTFPNFLITVFFITLVLTLIRFFHIKTPLAGRPTNYK